MLDVRKDFPLLAQKVYGQPLVYLDNAATTQKPQVVLDRILDYYSRENSNVQRGVHFLGEQAGEAYAAARETVREFIHAASSQEIVFTRSTTESINLVAASFGQAFVQPGDEILVTQMEHHSNLLPWQALCQTRGARLKVLPLDKTGTLQMTALEGLLTPKTKLLAVTYVSNALGLINPIQQIIDKAHEHGVPVLVDAAQAIQHLPLDVQALKSDFLVFSGHKMYADTGIGVLHAQARWLEAMPPYQQGGGMIARVGLDQSTFAELPFKFEAGTVHVAGAVSLQTAIAYLQNLGLETIHAHETQLLEYAADKLNALDGVNLVGPASGHCGVLSFNLQGAHPYDVGQILDKQGIAVRTGNHCAEPLMAHLGIPGTVRLSVALYNTREDIDRLGQAVEKAQALLSKNHRGVTV